MKNIWERKNFFPCYFSHKKEEQLLTTLYTKPTDCKTLLHANNFHAVHLYKKSLPVSQLIRIKQICDIPEEYQRNKANMINKVELLL